MVTVEEGVLMGGFGSAVLEAAADAGLDASHVRRLGIPDQFIEHGSRSELLADLGLDAAGIVRACRQWIGRSARARHGIAQSRQREILMSVGQTFLSVECTASRRTRHSCLSPQNSRGPTARGIVALTSDATHLFPAFIPRNSTKGNPSACPCTHGSGRWGDYSNKPF